MFIAEQTLVIIYFQRKIPLRGNSLVGIANFGSSLDKRSESWSDSQEWVFVVNLTGRLFHGRQGCCPLKQTETSKLAWNTFSECFWIFPQMIERTDKGSVWQKTEVTVLCHKLCRRGHVVAPVSLRLLRKITTEKQNVLFFKLMLMICPASGKIPWMCHS